MSLRPHYDISSIHIAVSYHVAPFETLGLHLPAPEVPLSTAAASAVSSFATGGGSGSAAAARARLPSDDASGGFLRVRSRAAYHGSSRGYKKS